MPYVLDDAAANGPGSTLGRLVLQQGSRDDALRQEALELVAVRHGLFTRVGKLAVSPVG